MSLNSLLSTVILVSFIVTIVFAIATYATYKMRERRRPASVPGMDDAPVFFERVYPAGPGSGRAAEVRAGGTDA